MPLPPIGSTQSMAIYNQQGAFTTSGVKEDDASTLPAPETFGSIQPCNDQVSQPGTQPNPCSDNVVCSQGCTADACTAEACTADAPAPCNDATCGGEACAADACAANAEQPPPPTGSL